MAGDLVKEVLLKIIGDSSSADDALDRVARTAEELKAAFPEYVVQIDDAAALMKMELLKSELKDIVGDGIKVPVKPDLSFASITGYGALGTSILSGLSAATMPALGLAGGLASGIGLAVIVQQLLSILPLLAAAGQGLVVFGALAYPEFDTLLTAVEAGKAGLKGLNKEQQNIVLGALDIENEYKRLAAAIAPSVDKLLTVVVGKGGIASQILQDLPPFANAAVGPIDTLLNEFDKFLKSKGAQQFQDLMLKLEGPAILAIGQGIGKVGVAIGQFLEDAAKNPNALKDLADGFTILAGAIRLIGEWTIGAMNNLNRMVGSFEFFGKAVAYRVDYIKQNFDRMTGAFDAVKSHVENNISRMVGAFEEFGSNIARWATDARNDVVDVENWFAGLPVRIVDGLSSLAGDLESIGRHAIDSLIAGFESRINSLFADALSWGTRIANDIGAPFGIHFSEPSEAVKMVRAGQNIARGLAQGILTGRSSVASAFAGLTPGSIAGGGGGAYLSVQASGDQFSQFLALMIRQYVRVHGGGGPSSVQRALGTGVA